MQKNIIEIFCITNYIAVAYMASDRCNKLILKKMNFNAAYNSRFRLTVMKRRRLQRAV
jgi:hypothetical protein